MLSGLEIGLENRAGLIIEWERMEKEGVEVRILAWA